MTHYIGIDPGKKGAIALLNKDELILTVADMPDTIPNMWDFIMNLPDIRAAVIEKPFYPRQCGTKNVATMAYNFGILKACLSIRGIPAIEVTPQKWKASLNVASNKDEARRRASDFFPDYADQWKLKKHDGRAESALIAWYAMGVA